MPQGRSCTAWAMAFPRKATSSTAVLESNAPAAWRAEYSPRLRPAATSGMIPFSRSTAVTPAAKATMQGWVYWVWDSFSSGPSKHSSFRSKSSWALSSTCRKAG